MIKKSEIWPRFSTLVACASFSFQNAAKCQKSKTSREFRWLAYVLPEFGIARSTQLWEFRLYWEPPKRAGKIGWMYHTLLCCAEIWNYGLRTPRSGSNPFLVKYNMKDGAQIIGNGLIAVTSSHRTSNLPDQNQRLGPRSDTRNSLRHFAHLSFPPLITGEGGKQFVIGSQLKREIWTVNSLIEFWDD